MAVRQSRGHASWKKFAAAFSDALGDVGEQLTGFGRRIVTESCEEFIHTLDSEWPHESLIAKGTVVTNLFGGDRFHPWYYGQLHDSVFVRIAEKNRTIAIRYMPQRATQPQHASAKDAGQAYDRIVGAEFAAQEAHNIQYVFLPGIQMQLVVAVPYARKVNETSRHQGYLDELQAQFFSYVEDRIATALEDNPKNRTRVFTPKK